MCNKAICENASQRQSYIGELCQIGISNKKKEILDLLPVKWADLHISGAIHIHDLEAYNSTYNCLVIDILKDFPYDKFKNQSSSRQINSLFDYLKSLFTRLGNEQSGGMALGNFDIELAIILEELNIFLDEENKEYIKNALYSFITWCAESHDRMGQISYYITFNIGLAQSEMGRFIAFTLLDEFLHSNYFKPNIVFKVKQGINFYPKDTNYYIFLKSLECTCQKMIPTYLLCDAKINKIYNEKDLAIVGCRTRVAESIHSFKGSIGRGNIANISVNLPRIALEVIKKNISNKEDSFKEELARVFEETSQILVNRYNCLLDKNFAVFPTNSEQNLWCTDFKQDLKNVFKHGTLSVGFIGLSETIEILYNEAYFSSSNLHKKALEIVEYMRILCDGYTQKYQLNFSLLGTSGELISGRFNQLDKDIFNHSIHNKGFYTNSFHVYVDSKLSPFKKIELEGDFHNYANGGSITYIELGEIPIANSEAIMELIEHAIKHEVNYLGFNFPLDLCTKCGAKGMFDICDNCNSSDIKRIRRVSGYLEELDYFTAGKKKEVASRLKN